MLRISFNHVECFCPSMKYNHCKCQRFFVLEKALNNYCYSAVFDEDVRKPTWTYLGTSNGLRMKYQIYTSLLLFDNFYTILCSLIFTF